MGHFSNALFILLSSCRVFLGAFPAGSNGEKDRTPPKKNKKTKKQKKQKGKHGKMEDDTQKSRQR
jgi:hypothetical protein